MDASRAAETRFGENGQPGSAGRSLPLLGRLYLWATHRLYNEFAWAYDAVAWMVSAGRWDRWRRLALEHVEQQPVLEVGFGTGELLLEMARRGWQVTGIDLSPAMQRVTARKLRRQGLWAPRIRGRVEGLPFPDDHFGAIISTFPAEYIVHPEALAEFGRVLRSPQPAEGEPGGRVIIAGLVVTLDHALARRAARFVFGEPPESPVARFGRLAEAAGLKLTVVTHQDPPAAVPILLLEKQ